MVKHIATVCSVLDACAGIGMARREGRPLGPELLTIAAMTMPVPPPVGGLSNGANVAPTIQPDKQRYSEG
jgi:hypothetical protein